MLLSSTNQMQPHVIQLNQQYCILVNSSLQFRVHNIGFKVLMYQGNRYVILGRHWHVSQLASGSQVDTGNYLEGFPLGNSLLSRAVQEEILINAYARKSMAYSAVLQMRNTGKSIKLNKTHLGELHLSFYFYIFWNKNINSRYLVKIMSTYV